MALTFVAYQQAAMRTAIYPERARVQYPAMKLAGEAGEAAGKLVALRQAYGNDEAREAATAAFLAELGDVLWYTAALTRDLDAEEAWLHEPLENLRLTFRAFTLDDTPAALTDDVLSLVSVASEPAERYGKLIRDHGVTGAHGIPSDAREKLLGAVHHTVELLGECADLVGTSLEQVAEANLAKLASRQERGVLTGSGDTR